jgi:pSer/pThr/pTyr-binding forkhead associated (FHA) protein
MSIQLTVMSLEYGSSVVPTKEVFEKDEITLGRLPENDVVLDKQDVSGVHARIRINRDGPVPKLCITDLGSSNGTMVENNAISSDEEVSLENEERIIIGTFLIKLTLLDDEVKATSPVTNGSNGNGSHVANGGPVELDAVIDASDDPFLVPPKIHSESEPVDSKSVDVAASATISNEEKEKSVSSSETFAMPYVSSPTMEEKLGTEDTVIDAGESQGSPAEKPVESGSVVEETGGLAANVETSATEEAASGKAVSEDATQDTSDDYEVKVVLSGDDVLELDFEAAALYGVRAKVLHKGAPLEGVEISDPVFGSKTTDSQGQIVFDDIEEDTAYKLSATKEKFIFETESAEGTIRDDHVEIVFNARELFTIKGSVRHKGKPLADVEVDGGPLGTTRTDADGVYRFENAPEGEEYSIKVKKPKFAIRKK